MNVSKHFPEFCELFYEQMIESKEEGMGISKL